MRACAKVFPVPVLSDNYSYLLVDESSNLAACVDPAEPAKVLECAKKHNANLTHCLTTHKHWDHSGGNAELKTLMCGKIDFIASAYESVPCTTHPISHNDTVELGNLVIKALHAPCHTKGHILYYVQSKSDPQAIPILFTGDTLFIGGCGRFFEGNAEQMVANMEMIKNLSPETLLYVGHEYTMNNLKFVLKIEPKNQYAEKKLEEVTKTISCGKYSVPATLKEEIKYNLFLRFDDPELQALIGTSNNIETMSLLRQKKDMF